jgi:hypothetical protein
MAKNEPAETPEPSETKPATVEASELNGAVEMPTASERTIAAMESDNAPTAPASSPTPTPASPTKFPEPGELDSKNHKWYADKYLPRKDSIGRWIPKNAGRKKRGAVEFSESDPNRPTPETTETAPASSSVVGSLVGTTATGDRFDLAAELYTRASYSVADGIFSANGEWLPESDGEHVALRGAVASYLRHKNSDDLPPGLALALAIATYGAKRVSKPNTQTKIRMFAGWIRAKFIGWRNGGKLDDLPKVVAPSSEHSPLPPQSFPGGVSP